MITFLSKTWLVLVVKHHLPILLTISQFIYFFFRIKAFTWKRNILRNSGSYHKRLKNWLWNISICNSYCRCLSEINTSCMLHLSCRWDQEVKHVALQGPWPCWFCTNHLLGDRNDLFHLLNCIFRAECGSQEIVYNSADLHKRPKFSSLYLLCDVLELPGWKVLTEVWKNLI